MLHKSFFQYCIMAVVGITLPTSFVSADSIAIYNENNPPSATKYAAGWYTGFSVQFDDSALTIDPTATLPSKMYLDSMTISHADQEASTVFLKVFTSADAAPTSWIGDSLNSTPVGGTTVGNATFTFDDLEIIPSTTYYFYLSNVTGDPTASGYTASWSQGRFNVSSASSNAYSGNLLYWTGSLFEVRSEAYDSVFAATFSTEPPDVPEPSTAVLLLGVFVSLIAFRRTRK